MMIKDITVSPAGLRIVKLLVGQPPKTVAGLIRSTGVTRTAVTEQLNDLVAARLVERSVERLPGRGRPRHVYKATDAALLLFANDQQLVMSALWRAIFDVCGEDAAKKVIKRVSRAMADYYSQKITAKKPLERLRQLISLFANEGELIELAENHNGHWTLDRLSCPFAAMADTRQLVCRIDHEIISAVVGRHVRRVACRRNGDPCCTFEIADE
jgi:DeoR family transcriptional regulator, suf operon transcriptional repressor